MNHNAEPETDISLDTNQLETTEAGQQIDHAAADVSTIERAVDGGTVEVDEDTEETDDDNDDNNADADDNHNADADEADNDDSDETRAETQDSANAEDDSDTEDSDDSDVDDSDSDDSDVDDSDVDDSDSDDSDVDDSDVDDSDVDDTDSDDADDDEDPHGEFDENGQRVTHNAIDPIEDEDDADDADDADDNGADPSADSDDPANMAWTVDDLLASLQQDAHQHGLQCAYELAQQFPQDLELQIAGLVHDVAHRISSEAMHGIVAADLVRPLYGDRVASLVELHVDAKRYLVTVDPTYHAILSPESVHTLMLQGSTMDAAEQLAFENNHHFGDAVTLRRADDAAKIPGRSVPDLAYWEPILRSAVQNEQALVDA